MLKILVSIKISNSLYITTITEVFFLNYIATIYTACYLLWCFLATVSTNMFNGISFFFKASFIITVWLKLKFTRYLQHPTPNLTYDPSLQSNLKHPLSNALRLKINTETFTQSTIAKYWLQLNVTLGNNYFALPMGLYCNQFKYIIFYTPLS